MQELPSPQVLVVYTKSTFMQPKGVSFSFLITKSTFMLMTSSSIWKSLSACPEVSFSFLIATSFPSESTPLYTTAKAPSSMIFSDADPLVADLSSSKVNLPADKKCRIYVVSIRVFK